MAILELSQTHRLYPILQNVLFSLSLNDFGCLGQGAQHSVPSPQQRPTCLSGWPLRAQQDTIDCLFTFVEKTLCGHWWGVGEGEVFLLVEFQTRYFSIIAGVALRKQCSFKVSFVFGLNWDITIGIIDRKTQKDRVFNVGQEMAKN